LATIELNFFGLRVVFPISFGLVAQGKPYQPAVRVHNSSTNYPSADIVLQDISK
jgi:hypothetical protein